MRTYLRVCAAVAALVGIGFLLPAGFGQPPAPETRATPKPPARPQLGVKVFKLERGDPAAVTLALTNLLEEPDMEVVPPMPAAPATPPAGAGMLGIIGTGPGTEFVPVWRATTDDRVRAVIVRGSARHIQVAADLVAVLDRAPNAPLPQLQVVKAFALKHADSIDLARVIEQLSFDGLRVATPDEKLLAVVGPDEATKAIAELVKELDVPEKPAEEPKKEPEPKGK